MDRIGRSDLYIERAILHGKKGEHHYALDLLVNRLGDHEAAEEYCVDVAKHKDRAAAQEVFLHLLDVYLQPSAGGESNAAQAMHLLNNPHFSDLDADKVRVFVGGWCGLANTCASTQATGVERVLLMGAHCCSHRALLPCTVGLTYVPDLLPPRVFLWVCRLVLLLQVLARVPLDWSIGVVDRFLRQSIRSTMHAQRTKRIEHGLARQENLQARAELVQLEARYVVISESRRCHGCHRFVTLPPLWRLLWAGHTGVRRSTPFHFYDLSPTADRNTRTD
jgi:hypothetical protein